MPTGAGETNLTPKDSGDLDSQVGESRALMVYQRAVRSFHVVSAHHRWLDTEIFLINADGTGLRRLTNIVGVDGSPNVR